jgi:hypothetical protein
VIGIELNAIFSLFTKNVANSGLTRDFVLRHAEESETIRKPNLLGCRLAARRPAGASPQAFPTTFRYAKRRWSNDRMLRSSLGPLRLAPMVDSLASYTMVKPTDNRVNG